MNIVPWYLLQTSFRFVNTAYNHRGTMYLTRFKQTFSLFIPSCCKVSFLVECRLSFILLPPIMVDFILNDQCLIVLDALFLFCQCIFTSTVPWPKKLRIVLDVLNTCHTPTHPNLFALLSNRMNCDDFVTTQSVATRIITVSSQTTLDCAAPSPPHQSS
jgi:hypothetical protein